MFQSRGAPRPEPGATIPQGLPVLYNPFFR